MQMNDIKIIKIVCGPGQIAYGFDKETGTLTFWTKDYIYEAPGDAIKFKIFPAAKTWSMEDMPDGGPLVHGALDER